MFFCKKTFYSLFFAGSLLISLFFTTSAGTNEENKKTKTHICFFELDNTTTSKNFKKKIKKGKQETEVCKKKQTFSNTVVHCYQIQIGKGERGKQAFERMITEMTDNGEVCDSLVLSGHHTGDWFGKTGTLWLKDMEALSCNPDPKYRDWFKDIKALWLDGCNTVTDNFIQSATIPTPDSETVRVLGKEVEDKTKINKRHMVAYQQSYSASLDENTSLSSRYLRMFPDAQIYGFNGAAPIGSTEDNQIGDQSFIYTHLTNLERALSSEEKQNDTLQDFERGFKVLFDDDPCDPETWESVNAKAASVENQDYKRAYKLGCDLILAKQVLDNPKSTEAQKALADKIIQDNKEAQEILKDSTSTPDQKAWARKIVENSKRILNLANKILSSPNSKDAIKLAKTSILNTLKTINEADQGIKEEELKYSHLLFNNIYDTWNTAKKYKRKDSKFFNQVKAAFQTDSFTTSVEERIQSDYTASLRKGDYIKFYTEIHDINKDKAKARIVKEATDDLLKKAGSVFSGLKSPRPPYENLDDDTKRALAVSVVDQLFQYDLLSDGQIEQLMKNNKLFPKNTNNPFVMNVQTELKFRKGNPEEIIDSVSEQTDHSLRKRSEIRIGATILLNKRDKDSLNKLADKINRKNTSKEGDRYAFFTALYDHLRGKTDTEKVNILFELSKNTGANLEKLILMYSRFNLNDEFKKQLYDKMTSKTHNHKILLDPRMK